MLVRQEGTSCSKLTSHARLPASHAASRQQTLRVPAHTVHATLVRAWQITETRERLLLVRNPKGMRMIVGAICKRHQCLGHGTQRDKHRQTQTDADTHRHTNTYTPTHTITYIHRNTQTHKDIYTQISVSYTRKHTHTHKYTHTHTHTSVQNT